MKVDDTGPAKRSREAQEHLNALDAIEVRRVERVQEGQAMLARYFDAVPNIVAGLKQHLDRRD